MLGTIKCLLKFSDTKSTFSQIFMYIISHLTNLTERTKKISNTFYSMT